MDGSTAGLCGSGHRLRHGSSCTGKYLIDFLNPALLERNLVPISVRVDKQTGVYITETRSIENDFVVKKIELKYPADQSGTAGAKRFYEERVRLISLEQFKGMIEDTGLVLEEVYGDYDKSAYAAVSSKRLILLGGRR